MPRYRILHIPTGEFVYEIYLFRKDMALQSVFCISNKKRTFFPFSASYLINETNKKDVINLLCYMGGKQNMIILPSYTENQHSIILPFIFNEYEIMEFPDDNIPML